MIEINDHIFQFYSRYNEVAYALYDTIAEYTLDIQAVSCDEMLVDITELVRACSINPMDFSQVLRDEMFQKTQCRASVGLGPNLLLARMATRYQVINNIHRMTDARFLMFFFSLLFQESQA